MAVSSNSIGTLLQQEFGLIVQEQASTAAFQFDALLRSSTDPMPVFIIEDMSTADSKAVKEKCRKLESFIWNLYRAGNVNTVTAIFITSERTAAEELVAISKRLSGTGRLFFVNRNSTRDDLLHILRPLVPPKLSEIETTNQELATVIKKSAQLIAEMTHTPVVGDWVGERLSAEQLKDKAIHEFERLMKEFQNAIK